MNRDTINTNLGVSPHQELQVKVRRVARVRASSQHGAEFW